MAGKLTRTLLNGLALGVGLGAASEARAFQSEVDATLDAQFYSLQSPYGSPLLQRRRYTQTLALNLYDIQADRRPLGPTLSFKSRLRLDADFGQRPEERNPDSSSYIPGLVEAPVDVMYAYLEGSRYLDGYLGFRLGRQYVVDSLGFWSFDGVEAMITTPAYLALEAYVGFEQRGGLPMLSTSRFEAGGVSRGDRSGLGFGQSPSFLQESKLAPAYGFALESSGVHFLHSRFTYRKVINRDAVLVSPFLDNGGGLTYALGDRTSSERLGYSLRADKSDLGAVLGSIVYDLYNRRVSQYNAGLDWFASDRAVIGAGVDYFLPTFDGDSIFNWFTHRGTTSGTLRADLAFSRQFELAASGGVRMFSTEGDPHSYLTSPDLNQSGRTFDYLGTFGGRYRFWDGSLALNTMAEAGEVGHRYGGDLTGRKQFDGGYYDTLAVLSLYDWEDALRPERSATSFSYVLGGAIAPNFLSFSRGRLGVEWEHTMNHLVGQRFRMLATLNFSVLR
ncbi:MAG TPA: hypothetical protein VER04_29775 [Polyangiaceae bacterium]|nr:hypothetical protein [Polyangiaceae bacterium]